MKVSKTWLKELVDLRTSEQELLNLLPLRSISIKDVTDSFIELDMKGYNRADLLSMVGVAQEVAAITGSRLLFKEPEEAEFVWKNQDLPKTPVRIEEDILSEVQCAVRIKGLEYGKSPEKWIKRLEDSGIRSVNNIVDVTNLIMLEYGQPLHCFDARDLENETINVRRAKSGEELVTLDGKVRKLTSEDIVLADTKKALDVAGVMGSKDTEVVESTDTIILSASIFNPQMVMKTAGRLGLHSEASKRFQHGLTKKRLLQALNGAIKMYEELGGKVTAINLVGSFEDKTRVINLTKQKLELLVGIKFEDKQVEVYLERLCFEVKKAKDGWEVLPPYFRLDVNIEEDVIEEIARMYGYEKIPATKVPDSKPLQKEDPIFQKISDLRQKLVDFGLTEVQTYSFYSTDVLSALGFTEQSKKFLIKVANPISAETEYLRMNIWPNLVEDLGKNLRRGFEDIAIFEIGKTYHQSFEETGNPEEEWVLSIALYSGSDNPLEELISIIQKLELDITLEQSAPQKVVENLFHPKRFIKVVSNSKEIGGTAEVHLRVLNKLGIEKRVAVLEIGIESIVK